MIDLDRKLNPAREGAEIHAELLAARNPGQTVCVYVAPPPAPTSFGPASYFNAWYVRLESGGVPNVDGIRLFKEVTHSPLGKSPS